MASGRSNTKKPTALKSKTITFSSDSDENFYGLPPETMGEPMPSTSRAHAAANKARVSKTVVKPLTANTATDQQEINKFVTI